MGSKFKVLPEIENVLKDVEFHTVLDAFSGSGCVSYMFKSMGKKVYSNDFMKYSHASTKALVENDSVKLTPKDVDYLLNNKSSSRFISETFHDLYFSDEDNRILDKLFENTHKLRNPYKKAMAFSAISRAMIKRRPRGIFTYVGNKFDDGRKDLTYGLDRHFLENVSLFNDAVFSNGYENISTHGDIFNLELKDKIDLVYFDPPYLSKSSDNDYVRRYHFVEGFIDGWKNVLIDPATKTRKFPSYRSMFGSKNTIEEAFEKLFFKFKDSTILLSYSSNSIPDKAHLVTMLEKINKKVTVYEIDHIYSFGTHGHKLNNQTNRVKEYLFLAR